MEDNNKKTMAIAMASIDKSYVQNIPQPIEASYGKKYVYWGIDNKYPEYLYNLYNDCNTLRTIICGTADYVQGDDAVINSPKFAKVVNKKGDSVRDFVKLLAKDYLTYGGFSFQVIRDTNGEIAELYWLDFRFVRTSKDGNVIYYSEDFSRSYTRQQKVLELPSFFAGTDKVESSVVYYKNEKSHVYPVPVYVGSLKACEIERQIDEYHLASLLNGFAPSYLISFNNGIPTDEEKAQIEADIENKFCGAANAGTFLLSFSNGKDNSLEVNKLDVQDFGEKYKAAATRAREQIFVAFRAVPALFGLMTESKGFSEEEFEQAFNLYNRTVVKSIQRTICDEVDRVFGVPESLTITPFSISGEQTQNVD